MKTITALRSVKIYVNVAEKSAITLHTRYMPRDAKKYVTLEQGEKLPNVGAVLGIDPEYVPGLEAIADNGVLFVPNNQQNRPHILKFIRIEEQGRS